MAKIPPKFVGLQHIAIKVHDIELARRFYTEILGFTITENYKPGEIPDFRILTSAIISELTVGCLFFS